MLDTLAGVLSVRSSLQQAAAVYWVIIRPLCRPGWGLRDSLTGFCGSQARSSQSVRRSAMPATWQREIVSRSSAIASGMP